MPFCAYLSRNFAFVHGFAHAVAFAFVHGFVHDFAFIFSLENLSVARSSGYLDHRRSKLNNLVGYTTRSKFSNKLGTMGIRSYSTNYTSSLHPQFITGISDAESSFFITFLKSNKSLTGYYIQLSFQISLHNNDRFLLELIKSFFGVGNIQPKKKRDMVLYQVTSIKDLAVIISHFNKYPLITKKRADFELFQLAFKLVNRKEHLNTKGFTEILSIKAVLNNGLSTQLETAFPNIIPYLRPEVLTHPIKEPQWVAGFTEGEGCFNVSVRKSNSTKSGVQVILRYKITQHVRDSVLVSNFIEYFGCGNFTVRPNNTACDFIVSNFSDICKVIIPFFDKYPLFGVKAKNYADFKKVVEIMRVKGHLTDSGLEEINRIKAGMNSFRDKKD
jgi:hypothetical protein